MNAKTILVVDHNRAARGTLSKRLGAEGYHLLEAEDGASAVSLTRQANPDLILLDISFPPDVANGGGVSWDGFLVLAWIRRMTNAKRTPVIFMTEDNPDKYHQKAVASGAIGLFQKPVNLDGLLSHISRILAKDRQAECVAS